MKHIHIYAAYVHIYIYIYIVGGNGRPTAARLLAPGHRFSRPRGTGSVGDSVGEGPEAVSVGVGVCVSW